MIGAYGLLPVVFVTALASGTLIALVVSVREPLARRLGGDEAGARWLLVAGCLLFAAGLLLTNVVINPNPAYLPLAAALGLAGAGIGTCVVPVTSSVLGTVPAERSGMAASATNTSREFGAVTGIAILGAVVNAELRSGLVSRMTHLGASAALQQYVLQVIETGLDLFVRHLDQFFALRQRSADDPLRAAAVRRGSRRISCRRPSTIPTPGPRSSRGTGASPPPWRKPSPGRAATGRSPLAHSPGTERSSSRDRVTKRSPSPTGSRRNTS